MTEDFIQNIQFDLFSVELVIGETATLLLAENYVTIREVFVDGVKVEPNENKQIFLTNGGDDLWELNEGDILQPKENRTFTIKKANEVDVINGSTDKYLNEQGDFTKPITRHGDLIGKNTEPEFQHVTQEEKTGFHTHTNKEYLDNYNPTLFATALQGEKADSALQSLPPNTVVDADYPALKDKVNGIEENANNYEHPLQHSTKILSEVNSIAGNIDKYLNERGDFTKPIISHIDLTYKNDETTYQHIDTATTKQTLVADDKVAIYDSVTGNVVLTDKTNVDNRYDAETVSAPANGGTLTLKNATETVISTTLTNSNTFTIALPATTGKVNESILIFKVGSTLPSLTQPTGVIYRTETPTIAINQTWTFCYERVTYDSGSTYEIYVSATKNV